jgi:hypothetical protein
MYRGRFKKSFKGICTPYPALLAFFADKVAAETGTAVMLETDDWDQVGAGSAQRVLGWREHAYPFR